MAEEKKTKPVATVKTETLKADTAKAAEPAKEKSPVKKAAAKVAEKKTAAKAAKAETKAVKAEAKAAKAETKAEAKKAPAKKAAAKPAAKKATAKEEAVKANISLQYQDKEWNVQALIQSAKDVWVYDLGRKAEEFKAIDLYVKPEENRVYFVVNGTESGDFAL